MIEFEDIQIEHDRITTPEGQIPLNSASTVQVMSVPRNQLAKKAAGAAFFAGAVATGGVGLLLLGPALGFLFHKSFYVSVNTDDWEYVVKRFGGSLSDPQASAHELKEIISDVIAGRH